MLKTKFQQSYVYIKNIEQYNPLGGIPLKLITNKNFTHEKDFIFCSSSTASFY